VGLHLVFEKTGSKDTIKTDINKISNKWPNKMIEQMPKAGRYMGSHLE